MKKAEQQLEWQLQKKKAISSSGNSTAERFSVSGLCAEGWRFKIMSELVSEAVVWFR
jgi:hypothetical protein